MVFLMHGFQHNLSGHRIVHTGQGKSELAAREFKAAGAFAFVVGLVSLCASIPNYQGQSCANVTMMLRFLVWVLHRFSVVACSCTVPRSAAHLRPFYVVFSAQDEERNEGARGVDRGLGISDMARLLAGSG